MCNVAKASQNAYPGLAFQRSPCPKCSDQSYSRRHVKRGRLRRERDSAELIVEASVERGASEHLPRIGSSAI